MEELVKSGDFVRLAAALTNDFEQVVFARHLPIALLHDELHMARARNARLCGSGSAVYGVAHSQAEADEIARIMRLKYQKVFVCRTMSREESLALAGNST